MKKHSDEAQYWLKYIDTCIVVNSWDTMLMAESGADVIKLAVTPKNEQDVLRLYEVEYQYKKQERKPFITIAMGDVGKVTRISGLFTGSCMTFGYIGRPSATGQISAKVLAQLRKDLTEERNNGKKV